jgi:hypothetical protein
LKTRETPIASTLPSTSSDLAKRLLAASGVLLLLPSLALAQGGPIAAANSEPIALNDLKTPASPAFQLLGIAPTDVERPTTPRAFAVSLLSTLQQSDTVLPNEFAMEVAPYWLVPRNGLDFSTYINPGPAQSVRQTFSISVASSKAKVPTGSTAGGVMDIGVGFRTSPWAGKAGSNVEKLRSTIFVSLTQASVVDALLAQTGTPTGTVPTEIATIIGQLRAAPHPGLTNAQATAIFDAITEALSAALGATGNDAVMRTALLQLKTVGDAARKKAALDLQTANQKRLGFTMDIAGAVVARTRDAQDTDTRVTREGLWSTIGYSDQAVSVLGVVRYVGNTEEPSPRSNLLDTGLRVIGNRGDLTVSFEALRRSDFSSTRAMDSTFKAVVNIEYKISQDVSITSTFGRDFGDTRLGRIGSTVSLLGVSFGLGSRPVLPVTAK